MYKKGGTEPDEAVAMRISGNSIILNLLLSVFKFTAGILAHSGAMVSDAVHSASDVFSTIIVIIGVKAANRASDEKHQYGHERMECVASLLLSVVLFATGAGIGINGVMKIVGVGEKEILIPGFLALAAAFLSIAVKEGMYWYTRNAAKRINSTALMADAWHHRSDALSSVGSLIGILGARLGFPIFDPAAGAVISLFIIKASIDIFRDAIGKMTDEACDENTVAQMRELILNQNGVLRLDVIKTRRFGSRIYVDIEIAADGSQTLEEAHLIAESVHQLIEERFPRVKHCMVHVNPVNKMMPD